MMVWNVLEGKAVFIGRTDLRRPDFIDYFQKVALRVEQPDNLYVR